MLDRMRVREVEDLAGRKPKCIFSGFFFFRELTSLYGRPIPSFRGISHDLQEKVSPIAKAPMAISRLFSL